MEKSIRENKKDNFNSDKSTYATTGQTKDARNLQNEDVTLFYDPLFLVEVLAGERVKNEGKKGYRIDTENLWK